ncbi:Cof-type HAD-IIB family hydrolase [Caproiciproducens galactitolivorans]|uniref:Cof-type HAD-IIB family hydrolase n=1 Tax=Caproiciproducens galactitolivorans TaxID=642589 RepID=UPI002408FB1F|nr:Cof-type HAD-IIB family hydrolase [Caproiciproducens galactitolivorans]
MNQKILALDLDGTAVNDSGKLGALSKQALISARQQGHILCFVTGRRDIDMVPLGKDACYADYFILNNGGKITSAADGRVLKNDFTGKEDARALISYCLQKDCQLHIFSGMYWGINKMTPRTRKYAEELGLEPDFYHSPEDVQCENVEGFTVTDDGEKVRAFLDNSDLDLEYVASEPGCLDIMKKGINKWNGIKVLADFLAIPISQTIAVGNYDNDIDMLTHAGIGIAVQNALPDVKTAADYITLKDNNHDAVAEIVEKFLLSNSNYP